MLSSLHRTGASSRCGRAIASFANAKTVNSARRACPATLRTTRTRATSGVRSFATRPSRRSTASSASARSAAPARCAFGVRARRACVRACVRACARAPSLESLLPVRPHKTSKELTKYEAACNIPNVSFAPQQIHLHKEYRGKLTV
eukprot:6214539-Pleurochrysis_carterae.AAC.4